MQRVGSVRRLKHARPPGCSAVVEADFPGVRRIAEQAGRTVDAGKLGISAYSGVTNFGARSPAWRSDGSNLAFVLNPGCTVRDVSGNPGVGPTVHALLAPKTYQNFCIIARGPTPAIADRILLATSAEANSYVYLATEGASTLGRPILAFNDYNQISDMEWLPDGSGFIMSRRDSLMDGDVNLYQYDFASRKLRQLTDSALQRRAPRPLLHLARRRADRVPSGAACRFYARTGRAIST